MRVWRKFSWPFLPPTKCCQVLPPCFTMTPLLSEKFCWRRIPSRIIFDDQLNSPFRRTICFSKCYSLKIIAFVVPLFVITELLTKGPSFDTSPSSLPPSIWSFQPKLCILYYSTFMYQVLTRGLWFAQHTSPSPQLALQREVHICKGTPEFNNLLFAKLNFSIRGPQIYQSYSFFNIVQRGVWGGAVEGTMLKICRSRKGLW